MTDRHGNGGGPAGEMTGSYAEQLFRAAAQAHQSGQFAAAEQQYRELLRIAPQHINGLYGLGVVGVQTGRFDLAADMLGRVLALDRGHMPALMALGNLHAQKGELDQAAEIYLRIIRAKPNPVAYENLALTHLMRGEPWRALPVVMQGFGLATTPKLRQLFVACVPDLRATMDEPDLRAATLRALTEGWCPALVLAPLAASFVKVRPAVAAMIERGAKAWPRRLPAQALFGPSGLADLAADRLLLTLLDLTHVADVELERFLTATRAALLGLADAAEGAAIEPNALKLLVTLARHCFLNEYVFAVSPEEHETARKLRDRLLADLQSGGQPPEHVLAAVACYDPLHVLPNASALLDRVWPDPIGGLLLQQVREPLEERAARDAIPRLTPIDDRVSRQVREQYEENPYPRWTRVVPALPRAGLDEHVRALFPHAPLTVLGKGRDIDILVAGCGTGPVVPGLAQQFPFARILAVDLSLTSLAYAQRKTRAAGFANVEYGQADILRIGAIGRSFDLIEARGVLHHLDDPLAGWRALLSVLRPNGIMAIGLYSELARAHLEPARRLIAERGYRATADDIRAFRQDIMDERDAAPYREILELGDFFTLSSCRDLLFHVREHRFTLPQIEALLKSERLRLLGFEHPAAVAHRYAARFPQDPAMVDLALWHQFEQEHPQAFSGMYQFWLQRNG